LDRGTLYGKSVHLGHRYWYFGIQGLAHWRPWKGGAVGIPAAFTIEAWIFPKGVAFNHPGAGPIAEFFDSISFFQFPTWSDLHVAFRDTARNIVTANATVGGIVPNDWNHAALTYDKDTGIARL